VSRNRFIITSVLLLLLASCSNQKNTKTTRLYHEINTRYNIYFNAEEAYKTALENKNKEYKDNLSEMIYMYPYYPDWEEKKLKTFETTIDKATKAIKLHSIQAKPERDPGKSRNAAYQEWLNQKEFNPFLEKVWMLMAKAEYQNNDYIRSLATFSYISRVYKSNRDIVVEAQLWIARIYLQMGWTYETENVFRQINQSGEIPQSQKKLYNEIYANYLVRSEKYEESIPYLEQAVKNESGDQKDRLKYLLGQVYAKTGNRQKAYETFGDIPGLGTSFELKLNSQLQQAQYSSSSEKGKVLSMLEKMSKQTRNAEYLDQVHYIAGNIYLQNGDTLDAIKKYNAAIEKSTRGGYDKAIAQVVLGDLHFTRKEYLKAQPLYPEALGILGKKYDRYKELTLRSEVLDELVVYLEAVHLQDSLQTLARMPEDERLDVINKLIADLKKKEEEEKKLLARQEWEDQNRANQATTDITQNQAPDARFGMNAESSFYFYNQTSVAQGKTAFKKQWGNRKLEDNWRRRDKSSSAFDDFFAEETPDDITLETDSLGNPIEVKDPTAQTKEKEQLDQYSPEYYIQQLPLTPEALAESNAIIEDAFYQMGLIYKNKLGDLYLAIDAFDTDIKRFPQTKNLEEIYYQLFLIYSQLSNKNMADIYRNKLLGEFPSGDYAVTLSDPNYEWNLRNLPTLQNDLYQSTYDAYIGSKINSVRQNYQTVKEKYPLSDLMPKFMFLNALTYAQTNDAKEFRDNLKELVDKYPNADVTSIASDMLQGVISGRPLIAGGPARGMYWNIQFGGQDFAEADTTLMFKDLPEDEHLVLMLFDPSKVKRNDLLYDVADYNFSNFVLQTFDLSFSAIGTFEMLQVKGLASFSDVSEYINKAFADSSLIQTIDSTIVIIPISNENFNVLQKGKSLNEYFDFFNATYKTSMPRLIAYWNQQLDNEEKEDKEEAEKTEELLAESGTSIINEPVTIGEKEDAIPDKQQDIPLQETIPEKENDPQLPVREETKEENIQDKTETDNVDPIIAEEIPEKQDDDIYNNEADTDAFINEEDVEKGISVAQDAAKTIEEVMSNPVEGIKNLIQNISNTSSKPKLTKEEKEAEKEEKERLKQLQKEQKAKEKALQDSIKAVEKARVDSIKLTEKEEAELEKIAERAKEDARKAAIKEKEDARKEREQDLKEKQRAREQEMKQKEKERKERQKQKEEEREQRAKEKEKERKEKEKQRREEQKEKERAARERQRNR